MFAEDKITLREGVIRVLEQEINPIALLANANPDVGIESDVDQDDDVQAQSEIQHAEVRQSQRGQISQVEEGHFTRSGISNALGMGTEPLEVKTVDRVFEKLLLVHSERISKIHKRDGKKFEYHYHIQRGSNSMQGRQ